MPVRADGRDAQARVKVRAPLRRWTCASRRRNLRRSCSGCRPAPPTKRSQRAGIGAASPRRAVSAGSMQEDECMAHTQAEPAESFRSASAVVEFARSCCETIRTGLPGRTAPTWPWIPASDHSAFTGKTKECCSFIVCPVADRCVKCYNVRHGESCDRHLHVRRPPQERLFVRRQDSDTEGTCRRFARRAVLHRASAQVREVSESAF